MTLEELTKPTVLGVKGRQIYSSQDEADKFWHYFDDSGITVFERDAQVNPLTSARFMMGADPYSDKSTYDPDFVFEVNGKKYVMQEEAFRSKSLLDKTMLLNRLQELEDERLAKQRTPIVIWTTEQGMKEFDLAMKKEAAKLFSS